MKNNKRLDEINFEKYFNNAVYQMNQNALKIQRDIESIKTCFSEMSNKDKYKVVAELQRLLKDFNQTQRHVNSIQQDAEKQFKQLEMNIS